MTETKTSNLEREYIIPLRVKWSNVPRYRRAGKAVKSIKEFLVRHMKIRDRDLNKVKVDTYLNEYVWFRGIKHPPAYVKVRATKKDDVVMATLAEFPDKLKFKKARADKIEDEGKKIASKKKAAKEELTKEDVKTEESQKKEEEKKASVVEAGKQIAKQEAKAAKHSTGGKSTAPKRPQRKALAK